MSVSLSFDNTIQVLERLAAVERLVLVGGQALNYWCGFYRSGAESLNAYGPFASKDVDFQGDRKTADHCARLLGGKYLAARSRGAPAMLGVVTYTNREGVEHAIDFLSSVYGLKTDEVLEFSIPVTIPRPNGRVFQFRVMNPLHCLESRVHNVVGLANKYANEHGTRQLRASIVCAHEFIRSLARAQGSRVACDSNERIFRLACEDVAVRLHAIHGIDVLDAVVRDDSVPEAVRLKRYPQMKAALLKKRGG